MLKLSIVFRDVSGCSSVRSAYAIGRAWFVSFGVLSFLWQNIDLDHVAMVTLASLQNPQDIFMDGLKCQHEFVEYMLRDAILIAIELNDFYADLIFWLQALECNKVTQNWQITFMKKLILVFLLLQSDQSPEYWSFQSWPPDVRGCLNSRIETMPVTELVSFWSTLQGRSCCAGDPY